MKKNILLLALATVAFGCSSVKSDVCFERGKDSFWNGRYDDAIGHLNAAIELDPSSSRNHHQLAMTFEKLGDITQAWEHARKAYILDNNSRPAIEVFTRVFSSLATQHRLEIPHRHPASRVIETLGIADKYLHDENGDLRALYYGPICLYFDEGKLSTTEWLRNIR